MSIISPDDDLRFVVGTYTGPTGASSEGRVSVALGASNIFYGGLPSGDSVTIGTGTPKAAEHEVRLGAPTVTSFRVGDWLHVTKDDYFVVSREWVDSIEERCVFLEGLVNCMSRDVQSLRERLPTNIATPCTDSDVVLGHPE
jgi:hypothetical protein